MHNEIKKCTGTLSLGLIRRQLEKEEIKIPLQHNATWFIKMPTDKGLETVRVDRQRFCEKIIHFKRWFPTICSDF